MSIIPPLLEVFLIGVAELLFDESMRFSCQIVINLICKNYKLISLFAYYNILCFLVYIKNDYKFIN